MVLLELLQTNPMLAIGFVFVFGLLVGSFLNVVILRLPERMKWQWACDCKELLEIKDEAQQKPPGIVVKGSHCPKCKHKLSWWENIPVLSYVLLKGRCRGCQTKISMQYPLVELVTGVLFALVVWQLGVTWQGMVGLVFVACMVTLSGIDFRTKLLPDSITLPLVWLGLLLSLKHVFVSPQQAILGAAIGYLSLWSVFWLFKLLTGKEGMGYGDFKLLAVIGAFFGINAIFPVILISAGIGSLVGGLWLVLKGKNSQTQIPFGPYLAGAGVVQLLVNKDLWQMYLNWIAGA